MRKLDLLFLVGTFRSATPMLAAIRHLAPRFRVGVLFADLNARMETKIAQGQALFRDLARQYGAVVCDREEALETRLLIVQQFAYEEAFLNQVKANVRGAHVWGMMTLAWAGIAVQDAYMQAFGVENLTVPDKGLAQYLIEKRGAQARYAGREMIEVGLPFRAYPLFEDFKADWIIAAPTLFSFTSERGKQAFLRAVLKLMAQMPASDVVAYKPHNGNKRDYFTPRLYDSLAAVLGFVPFAEKAVEALAGRAGERARGPLERLLTAFLHRRLLRRATPMARLTPYADISLEAFLPQVKKGVIGGLSNTIWGSLFFGLPYYNCVDDADRQGASELLKKDASPLLDMNLAYFGVPFCGGDLARGARSDKVVWKADKHRDWIGMIENALGEDA